MRRKMDLRVDVDESRMSRWYRVGYTVKEFPKRLGEPG